MINAKQDTLISDTNIKTINNESSGSIDPDLLKAYIPLSGDFLDDFNNNFAR